MQILQPAHSSSSIQATIGSLWYSFSANSAQTLLAAADANLAPEGLRLKRKIKKALAGPSKPAAAAAG